MVIILIITLCIFALLTTIAFFIRLEFVRCILLLLSSLLLVIAGLVFYFAIRGWNFSENILFLTNPLIDGAFLMGLWAMVFIFLHNFTKNNLAS